MCPNCLTGIAMALGGAGSAVLVAATSLRFLVNPAHNKAKSDCKETAS